ncbi:MAG: VOC family protein [Candidatus Promineifilaceae bacterium]
MQPSLNKLVIYTKRMDAMIAFYVTHFDFRPMRLEGDRIVELIPAHGGTSLMLHPASKRMKEGQAAVKLVFDVADIEAFKAKCERDGFVFGATHRADGYTYANAKDPSKNSVQISSRAFRPKIDD